MLKILVVGPSPDKSKGGMATVIDEIRGDKILNSRFNIDIYESYIDGNFITRAAFSLFSYLRFLLLKKDYDIYHIHAASRGSTFRKGYYVRAAKRWGKKVILHIHGAEYMMFYDEISELRRKKMLDILKTADMIIALSQDWKEKFEGTFGLSNCVVLENGVNTERLSSAVTEPCKFQKSFLSLGQLGKRKGSYDLINAIKIVKERIPDIKLYLAGDGEISKVKEQVTIAGLDENVDVVGWADFDKKLELLKRVSTVVLPSYNEGLPMSILEGMACGKAIISTKVGAIPEVVKKENGILVEPGNVKGLASALIRCCLDLPMVENMSKQNILAIEKKYNVNIMHQKLSKIYKMIWGG